ncbi:hypothetical protein BCEP27_10978 [Burkholderia cepacia]
MYAGTGFIVSPEGSGRVDGT